MRLRDAAESRWNILVVQMEPRQSGEKFLAEVLCFLARSLGVFSAIGVESR